MDGLIWFGGIAALFVLAYIGKVLGAVLEQASYRRAARRRARNAERRRAMERHPASQGYVPTRPDAADYALRMWTERER